MKHILFLLAFILSTAFAGNAVYNTKNNDNSDFWVKSSGVMTKVGTIDAVNKQFNLSNVNIGTLNSVNGVPVYESNKPLSPADFPNTTTLYGWRAQNANNTFLTVYGGKDLTTTGTLTSAADHLGNITQNVFDGSNDYLTSSDAVFNFTGSFSVSQWMCKSDWASGSDNVLISRTNGSTGWILAINGGSGYYLYFTKDYLSTKDIISYVSASLSSGCHHLAFVRSSGSYSSVYWDGLLVGKTVTAASITASGNLEIGSQNGGSWKFNGQIPEIWIHNGTAWTSEQVKKIYTRSSRLYATVKPDGNIDVNLPLVNKRFNFAGYYSDMSSVSADRSWFYTDGKNVYVHYEVFGTSDSQYFMVRMPILSSFASSQRLEPARAMDNSVAKAATFMIGTDFGGYYNSGVIPISVNLSDAGWNGWTSSGSKRIFSSVEYPLE